MTSQNNNNHLPDRSEVKEENKWRLEDIFESVDSWNKEFEAVKEIRSSPNLKASWPILLMSCMKP